MFKRYTKGMSELPLYYRNYRIAQEDSIAHKKFNTKQVSPPPLPPKGVQKNPKFQK